MIKEQSVCRTTLRVDRYDPDQSAWVRKLTILDPRGQDFARYKIKSYRTTIDQDCNLVTLGGWAALLGGIAGTTIAQKYNAANCRIGLGSSVAGAVPGQTLLTSDTGSGSTTSYFQLVSAAPAIATGTSPATLTFTATFAGTVANFPWNEFGTDNGNASGVTAQGLGLILLNVGQSPQGTKPSGETWVVTETLQFGFPAASGSVT